VDEAGVFHRVPRIDDARLAEVFSREVLAFLVGRELLCPDLADRILSWRHTGFSVHSRVRAKTKPEAERVGKYMIRPVLSLERLSFLEPEAKVGYRWGQERADSPLISPTRGRIIDHLKLRFAAERPPPECAFRDLLMVADPPVEYFP
jgi:hypothetical protein